MPFNTDRVVYLMYFTAVSCHTYMKMSMPCKVEPPVTRGLYNHLVSSDGNCVQNMCM